MNWNTTPFLRLVVPFGAGVFCAGQIKVGLPVPLLVLLATAALAGVFAFSELKIETRWLAGFLLQFFWFLFGWQTCFDHSELRRDDHFSKKLETEKWLVGTLDDAPTQGKMLRVAVKIEALASQKNQLDDLEPTSGKLQIYLPDDEENQNFGYGDRVIFRTKITPVEPPKNPEAFDYQKYLHFQNTHFQAFVKTGSIFLLAKKQANPVWQAAFDCRKNLLELLEKHFPTPDEYAAATALLLGKKDDLPDDLRSAYVRSGSMHALAVSGTHVGVIFAGVIFLLRLLTFRTRTGRWVEATVAFVFIWGFTFLTGATASVVRAAVMFSIFLVSLAFLRHASKWNILAAAAFLQILANPYSLFDAGFQLSYSAVAGILYFYERFLRVSPIFQSKIASFLWKGLLVGMAAQLGTLPLSLFYFHQFPTYFWLSGWAVLLGGAVFLWGCAALVVCSWVSAGATFWLGKGLFWLVWLQNQLIYGIEKLPGSLIGGIWLTSFGAVGVAAVIVFVAAGFRFREKKFFTTALAVFALLISASSFRKIEQHGQRKIVVYQISRHSVFDFFDGQKLTTFSDSLSQKELDFAAQNLRCSAGADSDFSKIFLGRDTFQVAKNLFWHPPVVAFFDKKIIVVDANFRLEKSAPRLRADLILLRQNPKIDFEKTAQYFDCQQFVADGSNKPWLVEKWKTEFENLNLKLHDTRSEGAWQLDF